MENTPPLHLKPPITEVPDGMNPTSLIEHLRSMGLANYAAELEKKAKSLPPEERARQHLGSQYTEEWLERFKTKHPKMLELKKEVRILADLPHPILIQGPTGTGKELIARALHGSREGKFIAVNCTALPSELIESELFGHVKGAYTGALTDRVGKFRAAIGGTIFLDEIGDMPFDMQAKLLRCLQEKIICPLGSEIEYSIANTRIVCATNKDIISMIYGPDKCFREDLYFRIKTITLRTLPMKDRREDIPLILDSLESFDPNLKKFPRDFQWDDRHLQGNVRQIQEIVLRYDLFNKLPENSLL